jgi:hypothetical protein
MAVDSSTRRVAHLWHRSSVFATKVLQFVQCHNEEHTMLELRHWSRVTVVLLDSAATSAAVVIGAVRAAMAPCITGFVAIESL